MNSALFIGNSSVSRTTYWCQTGSMPGATTGVTSPLTAEIRGIIFSVFPAALVEFFQFFELDKADGSRDVRHPVVIAEPRVQVFLALAMVDDQVQPFADALSLVVTIPPSPVIMFLVA